MIFVTVGHQEPYDRLIRLVDLWAETNSRRDIFAQIGQAAYRPRNFPFEEFLSPDAYEEYMRQADSVVAHAGTGTIMQALWLGKPLLVLPRLSKFGETRNDHQVGTARHFADGGQILMAEDDQDFVRKLDALDAFHPGPAIETDAPSELIAEIRRFLGAK